MAGFGVLTAPLWLVAASLFLAFAALTAIARAPYGRCRDEAMRRKLARDGRVFSWDELERAAAMGGALVTDHPSAGWHAMRVWWTSDDVEYELADGDGEVLSDPRHRDYIDRYASPESPAATLVATAHGAADVKALEQRVAMVMGRCPALKRATLASGLLAMYADGASPRSS